MNRYGQAHAGDYRPSRRSFIKKTSGTVVLATAGGPLAACGKDNATDDLKADFPIVLADHPKLMEANQTVLVDAGLNSPLAVTRLSDEEFLITGTECNHEACSVGLDSDGGGWTCPCHGAKFDLDGVKTKGPATADLTPYGYNLTEDVLTVLA